MGNTSTRVAILGGGVAGCVLARRIGSMRGVAVDLIEREDRLGGSHASIEIDGAIFDTAPTAFGLRHPLFAMFPGLNDLFVEVEHQPRLITPAGSVEDYPPRAGRYLRQHGALATARAGLDLLAAKVRHRRRDDLGAYLRYYLGETIYRQSGLREYIERLFALPEWEIDLAFVRDRLEALADAASLRRTIARTLAHGLARATGRAAAGGEPWHCYVRPRAGFDAAYRHIAEDLRVEGVTIRLGAAVEAIERADEGFAVTVGGTTSRYDRVISTVQPAAVASYLGLEEAGDRGDRGTASLVTLFYRFNGFIEEPGNAFYNFTREGAWRRVVVLSRYYGRVDGEHYFVVECVRRDADESTIELAARDFEAHLPRLGFFDGVARRVGGSISVDAWPLARAGHHERIAALELAIAAQGIDLAGRQGALRYRASHEIVDAAHRLASRLDLRPDSVDI